MDHVMDLHLSQMSWPTAVPLPEGPAMLLLNKVAATHSDIDPEDLADLLARSGIDLIAERIETETTVVDLLDYDVRFGQGFLFSPPRPVRSEALQGAATETVKPGVNESPGALLAAS
jgi:cyclic-di-GMP phosphodiesterase TipF (flagellum assembly factor)